MRNESNFTNIESFFESLSNSCSTNKKKASLKIIYDICLQQTQFDTPDFRISTVGTKSKARGGPSPQSIRNSSGEIYRTLLNEFDRLFSVSTRKKLPRSDEDWVEEIEQPNIRWLVKDRLQELSSLRGELNLLKSQTVFSIDLRSEPRHKENFTTSNNLELDLLEKKALTHSISQETFSNHGWLVDVRGQVIDDQGRQVYKPGYVSAIKKIIEK